MISIAIHFINHLDPFDSFGELRIERRCIREKNVHHVTTFNIIKWSLDTLKFPPRFLIFATFETVWRIRKIRIENVIFSVCSKLFTLDVLHIKCIDNE